MAATDSTVRVGAGTTAQRSSDHPAWEHLRDQLLHPYGQVGSHRIHEQHRDPAMARQQRANDVLPHLPDSLAARKVASAVASKLGVDSTSRRPAASRKASRTSALRKVSAPARAARLISSRTGA